MLCKCSRIYESKLAATATLFYHQVAYRHKWPTMA